MIKYLTEESVMEYLEQHLVSIETNKGKPVFVMDSCQSYELEYLSLNTEYTRNVTQEVAVRNVVEMLEELKMALLEKLDSVSGAEGFCLTLVNMRNDNFYSCHQRFLELEKYLPSCMMLTKEKKLYVPADKIKTKHDIKIAVKNAMYYLNN